MSNIDILFWANLNPKKQGSFEDLICGLSKHSNNIGIKIFFILGQHICTSVQKKFNEFNVQYKGIPSNSITSPIAFLKVLNSTSPKIVHLNFIGYTSSIILISKLLKKKVIFTDHFSSLTYKESNNFLLRLKNLRRKFYARQIDKYIGVSKFVTKRLNRQLFVEQEKLDCVYNGIDTKRFSPIEKKIDKEKLRKEILNLEGNKPVVVYVGQIIKEKGIFVYLDAAEILLKKKKDIIFLIVGSGNAEKEIIKRIEEFNSKNVQLLGQTNNSEILFKISDVAVAPSIWEEAFGLVIAEASACGVPVIASNIGGIPEVLVHNLTGLLVKPGSAIELSKAIERLLEDKKLMKKLSINGRKYMLENFDLNQNIFGIIKQYNSLIK